MPQRIVFATYFGEWPAILHIASILRDKGYVPEAWVVGKSDQEALEALGVFGVVENLTDGFRRSNSSTTCEEALLAIRSLENAHGTPFVREDAALDRGLTGVVGPSVDFSSLAKDNERWNWDSIVSLTGHLTQRLQTLLNDRPICVLGETNKLWTRLTSRLSGDVQVPYFSIQPLAHTGYRAFLCRSLTFDWPDCVKLYRNLLMAGIEDEALREASKRQLAEITEANLPSEHLEIAPMRGRRLSEKAHVRSVVDAFSRWWGSRDPARREDPTAVPNSVVHPRAVLRRTISGPRRAGFYDRVAERHIPNRRFASFFLHAQPEFTVESLAFDFQDQVATARMIGACLPADLELLVKEHPHNAARRSQEVYGELATIPGVRLIHHTVNTAELIRRSSVAITLTGTVALEAMCLGTPAVILGDVYYEEFAGVTRVRSNLDLRRTLGAPQDLPTASAQEATAALAARIACSFPFRYPGGSDDVDNARDLVEAIILETSPASEVSIG